jgi:hypothetical protein
MQGTIINLYKCWALISIDRTTSPSFRIITHTLLILSHSVRKKLSTIMKNTFVLVYSCSLFVMMSISLCKVTRRHTEITSRVQSSSVGECACLLEKSKNWKTEKNPDDDFSDNNFVRSVHLQREEDKVKIKQYLSLAEQLVKRALFQNVAWSNSKNQGVIIFGK